MKGWNRNVLRSDEGSIVVVFILVILPLLIIGLVAPTETTHNSGSTHQLHRAVTTAVVGAAHMVNPASQAAGDPKIDPGEAHLVFRSLLASNLGLNEITMQPLAVSGVALPVEYHLIIYNGSSAYGIPAGHRYSLVGGSLTISSLPGEGFPRKFGIGEHDFTLEGSTKQVTMKEPGVMGIVRVGINPVLVKNGPIAMRWAAARVKT